jgi:hypothetical protein
MTRRYRATTFSIAVAGALAIAATRQAFEAKVFESLERSAQHRKHLSLRAQARELGFDLVKLNAESAS